MEGASRYLEWQSGLAVNAQTGHKDFEHHQDKSSGFYAFYAIVIG